jgi:hypothetical protein
VTSAPKARWYRILFNPLWREISTDPRWSRHWRDIHILYVCLFLLLLGSFVMAFQSEEFWLLSVPAAAMVASYFGAKALSRRYETILTFLAEHRSLDTERSLPPPPHGLSSIYSISIWMVISTFLAASVYGIAVSVAKTKERALIEYQMRQR